MYLMGVAFLSVATLMIWRAYASYLSAEKRSCAAFLSAIEDMKEKMRCYLYSPREWAVGYKSDCLSSSGFLSALSDGKSLAEAYETSKECLQICKRADEILADLFSRCGEGYLDGEIAMLDSAIVNLSAVKNDMEAQNSKKTKAAGALLGAVAAGMAILAL